MKVAILPRAEADIIRQFRYYLLDQDAPEVAVRFRDSVEASIKQLIPHPRMGTLFTGGSIPGLRSWPVKGFESTRIYYLEDDGKLKIVRILHGKRLVRIILKNEK